MRSVPLAAEIRREKGSRASRRMRREGFIPAVLYGEGIEPMPLKIFKQEFSKIMHSRAGEHSMVELVVKTPEGEKRYLSVIKEVQHDPVTDFIIHADFEYVHPDKPIHLTLPVEFVGTPEGVKVGGIFTPHLHELDVVCRVADAPEVIEIDVSGIGLGESLHIKDLSIPNVKIHHDPEETVASVVKPRGLEVAETAEEEEQPEEQKEAEKESEKQQS